MYERIKVRLTLDLEVPQDMLDNLEAAKESGKPVIIRLGSHPVVHDVEVLERD